MEFGGQQALQHRVRPAFCLESPNWRPKATPKPRIEVGLVSEEIA
jgi:hypothetical protein